MATLRYAVASHSEGFQFRQAGTVITCGLAPAPATKRNEVWLTAMYWIRLPEQESAQPV